MSVSGSVGWTSGSTELTLYKLIEQKNNVMLAQHQGEAAIHKVTKEIYFCYGHRLVNYEGKCRHLHGHNGRAEIEIAADVLDHRGMVVDFGDINAVVKTWIDQELDHKMLLYRGDPILEVLQKLQEPCYVMQENPTAENIAKLIFEYAVSQGLRVSKVTMWETHSSFAIYEA